LTDRIALTTPTQAIVTAALKPTDSKSSGDIPELNVSVGLWWRLRLAQTRVGGG
jgi:hypothetical protein